MTILFLTNCCFCSYNSEPYSPCVLWVNEKKNKQKQILVIFFTFIQFSNLFHLKKENRTLPSYFAANRTEKHWFIGGFFRFFVFLFFTIFFIVFWLVGNIFLFYSPMHDIFSFFFNIFLTQSYLKFMPQNFILLHISIYIYVDVKYVHTNNVQKMVCIAKNIVSTFYTFLQKK